MNIEHLLKVIHGINCRVRIKLQKFQKPDAWSWVIMPVPGYLETGNLGPWPVREVEWLEIDPVVMQHIGRLVAPRRLDSTAHLEARLSEGDIPYTILDGIIRVNF